MHTSDEALSIIDRDPPDFSVLDINLGGTTSAAVAQRLTDMNSPFVNNTGYGRQGILQEMSAAQLLQKLLQYEALGASIRATLGKKQD